MSQDPNAIDRMLAGLAEGRRRAIEQAKEKGALTRDVVLKLASDDQARGKSARGRAGRIARKLHGLIRERQVRNILATLPSIADSLSDAPVISSEDRAA